MKLTPTRFNSRSQPQSTISLDGVRISADYQESQLPLTAMATWYPGDCSGKPLPCMGSVPAYRNGHIKLTWKPTTARGRSHRFNSFITHKMAHISHLEAVSEDSTHWDPLVMQLNNTGEYDTYPVNVSLLGVFFATTHVHSARDGADGRPRY